jgi:hypothetical protein
MPAVSIITRFEPQVLKAYTRNEVTMYVLSKNTDAEKTYWCECDITVKPPLSLAHDKELSIGRTRIGMLKPSGEKEKQIKLYTNSNNFPDEYKLTITAYMYDDDGAIAERLEQESVIKCEG